jgi:hypothetical protein
VVQHHRQHDPLREPAGRQALTVLDHDVSVVAISAQPFALLWPRSASGPSFHIPDYFVRLVDGSGCVVDVRPASRIDARAEEQFTRSRSEAGRAGWDYRIFSGLEQPALATLTFLSGYRFDRCRPAASLADRLVAEFASPTPLGQGADELAARECARPPEVLVGCHTSNHESVPSTCQLSRAPLTTRMSADTSSPAVVVVAVVPADDADEACIPGAWTKGTKVSTLPSPRRRVLEEGRRESATVPPGRRR